ncbi:MAG: DUF4338 protein, partial [Magnetococcales bacterium]|nr:DUF4338 protein [Magnetococcales bacterium]
MLQKFLNTYSLMRYKVAFHVTRRSHFESLDVIVRPIEPSEERYFHELMQSYHYLGALPKIGNTILYIATVEGIWVSLLSFSAAALKNAARDLWIGVTIQSPPFFLKVEIIAGVWGEVLPPCCGLEAE